MVIRTLTSVHFQIHVFRSTGDLARGGKIVLTINIKIWIAVKQSSSLISSGQHTGFLSGQAAPRRRRLLGLGLAQWGAGGGGGSPCWKTPECSRENSTVKGKEVTDLDRRLMTQSTSTEFCWLKASRNGSAYGIKALVVFVKLLNIVPSSSGPVGIIS